MKRKRQVNRVRQEMMTLTFFTVLLVSFLSSMTATYFYFKDDFAFESSFIADIESRMANAADQNSGNDIQRLYKTGEHYQSIKGGVIYRKDELLVKAEDFIRVHLNSYKATLRDLYLDEEGIIYIDLGSEIKKNFRGDAYGEMKVLSGLFNGIKNIIPGLSAIKILIEGSEAETFGGHIDISRPLGEEIAYNIQ